VYIPAGTFWMGSKPKGNFWMRSEDKDPEARDNEKPRHQVTLSAFWMGETPVTQGQYQAVMGKNPSEFKGNLDRPVEQVSWEDANRFCQKLSKTLLKTTQETMTLPSESQWEYACRGGTDTRYSFGDDPASLGDYAWYDDNSKQQTHPVKQKKPNAWGLYDMHGNVWEWCADQWHKNYEGAPTDGSAWLSSDESKDRLLRGGSWDLNAWDCRSAFRHGSNPDRRYDDLGFRVVCRSPRTR
jgi:formylglycine-generating enzyme required for sulfatase activity